MLIFFIIILIVIVCTYESSADVIDNNCKNVYIKSNNNAFWYGHFAVGMWSAYTQINIICDLFLMISKHFVIFFFSLFAFKNENDTNSNKWTFKVKVDSFNQLTNAEGNELEMTTEDFFEFYLIFLYKGRKFWKLLLCWTKWERFLVTTVVASLFCTMKSWWLATSETKRAN